MRSISYPESSQILMHLFKYFLILLHHTMIIIWTLFYSLTESFSYETEWRLTLWFSYDNKKVPIPFHDSLCAKPRLILNCSSPHYIVFITLFLKRHPPRHFNPIFFSPLPSASSELGLEPQKKTSVRVYL